MTEYERLCLRAERLRARLHDVELDIKVMQEQLDIPYRERYVDGPTLIDVTPFGATEKVYVEWPPDPERRPNT